jgi:transposase
VNKITTLGIDLAKTVFQLHGVDWAGKVVLCRDVRRAQLMKTIAQLEPCLIGIEACGGANYWARRFAEFNHRVKIMSPQFVKPYRKSDKNDRNDADISTLNTASRYGFRTHRLFTRRRSHAPT